MEYGNLLNTPASNFLLFLATIILLAILLYFILHRSNSEEDKRGRTGPAKKTGAVMGAQDTRTTERERTETEEKEYISPADEKRPKIITIHNFSFDPTVLHIKAGTVVIWTNTDRAMHNIRSVVFNSPDLPTAGSFSFRFETPGTYDYYCGVHPEMKGRIVVER